MKIPSPYVDVNTPRGKCQSDRAVDGARATLRAWSGTVKHKWLGGGETTVEVVPDDDQAQCPHQDTPRRLHCSQLSASLELAEQYFGNRFRDESTGKIVTSKFSRTKVEFTDEAYWWKPKPRHVQERIRNLAWQVSRHQRLA